MVFGDLVQQGVTHNDFSLTGAILAISTPGFWTLALSWLTHSSRKLESLLDGEPRVIVCKGRIVQDSLRRDRLTHAKILSEMRSFIEQAGGGDEEEPPQPTINRDSIAT